MILAREFFFVPEMDFGHCASGFKSEGANEPFPLFDFAHLLALSLRAHFPPFRLVDLSNIYALRKRFSSRDI
jgi:hypothetical protein